MAKNANHVSHKKSKQIIDGKPKLPLASDLVEGEIAINFGKDVETISIKNESGDVVTFSSDNYFINEKGGFKRETNPSAETKVGLVNSLSQYYDTNIGKGAVIEGDGNTDSPVMASGDYSHAEGFSTTASGSHSHAEGYETKAIGGQSHSEGYYTVANNDSEHASGQYNISKKASTTFGNSGNTLFSVGNGTSTSARHNAFEIRQNGDIYISSGGTDILLQDNLGGVVDQVIDSGTSASTNAVATKAVYDVITDNELVWTNAYVAMSGIVSSHTENTEIHVTAADKEKLNSITGNVGTMAYQAASSYSSATQVNTALGNKVDKTEYATFSAATNTSIEDLSGQSETVAAALNELNNRISQLEEQLKNLNNN